jgi:DNA replication protein DnaC
MEPGELAHQTKLIETARRVAEVERLHPELKRIRQELLDCLQANPSKQTQAEIKKLVAAKKKYLAANHIPEGYEVPNWDCVLCQDMGFVGADPCRCRQKSQLERGFQSARMPARLRRNRLSGFDVSHYSDRETLNGTTERECAGQALEAATNFVASFLEGVTPTGLFISGGVGLGKTLLLSAITNELVLGGKAPLYTVFSDLMGEIKASFNEENGFTETQLIRMARECELLLLDDLGAEQVTDFVAARLFDIINWRYNAELPVIVASNLSLQQIGKIYSERIASRLGEMTKAVYLYGMDIRVQKTLAGTN